jgi:hypothetical protein
MGTKVGIVYAKGTGILRRYIYPTNDSELDQPSHVGKGEAMLVVDRKVIASPLDIWIELSQHLGKVIPSGRCVVADPKTGAVVGAIMADPALDAFPGFSLVSHDTADIGWSVVNGIAVAPVVIAAIA